MNEEFKRTPVYILTVGLHRCCSHKRVLVHLGQHCWAVCNMQSSPLLHASQWTTHFLVDAVQLEQSLGLFLLPSGRPHLRKRSWFLNWFGNWFNWERLALLAGVTSIGGCSSSGSGAGIGSKADPVKLESLLNLLLAEQSVEHLEADLWARIKAIVVLYPKCEERKSDAGMRPNKSWCSKYGQTSAAVNST